MTRKTLLQLIAAATLIGASTAASAAEPVGTRVVTGLGHWIAAQGNAALREIRDDLRKDLTDRLAPLVPSQPADAEPTSTTPDQTVARAG